MEIIDNIKRNKTLIWAYRVFIVVFALIILGLVVLAIWGDYIIAGVSCLLGNCYVGYDVIVM